MRRSAGILLPIFSLPSAYGIGSLGRGARAFADFLKNAGQRWWQILPVGPTGAGDSPYTSVSTFAGNPLFLDFENLAEQGLLTPSELNSLRVPDDPIDYQTLYQTREPILHKAFSRLTAEQARTIHDFAEQTAWLKDYALYRAAKTHFDNKAWFDWPDDALRRHEAKAVEHWRSVLQEDVAFHETLQYWFFTQWADFKQYVNQLGLGLIGDLPIYVSLDSSDVWSERKEFLLDAQGRPSKVAGVPPDYFSEEGQLWGNPLYDWNAQKADGFGWWIRRVEGISKLCDAIRIDHFRGLESYWAVPADAKTAKSGSWEKGPGMDLLSVLTNWFPNMIYIAEDLGILTPEVHALRQQSGLPGMKILSFAFSGPDNAYLPHQYETTHCICYTGTHDNHTLVGWYQNADAEERAFAERYLGTHGLQDTCQAILRCGQSSVAELFVAQIQDYLGLDETARINIPGTASGNWRWRLSPDLITPELADSIRILTQTYAR